MGIVKISNRKILDDLQAKLILRLGRKISLQETLDLCFKHAMNDFEELVKLASNAPALTPEVAEEIIAFFEDAEGIPYDLGAEFKNKDDQDIYSL
ncbi:MAG: hypothetical protein ACTSRP_20340 [Candidatus Helarchaeota archaeon]